MSNSKRIVAVVLAGGQGARFWPVSRLKRPKQFLSITNDGESLIQATVRRVSPLVGADSTLVVTNILHEPLIREHVPQVKVITEPVARNTAASIGLAAFAVAAEDPEAVMIVLPADHAVSDEAGLRASLSRAVELASKRDTLVTIGIMPSFAHTGYGYIKRAKAIADGAFEVGRFFEKPNQERAERYVESGEYLWNSGMFVFRAGVMMRALEQHMPSLFQGLSQIQAAQGSNNHAEVLSQTFIGLESVSIDFGVLEHARNCSVVVASDFGWNDVGSWDAWANLFAKDELQNLRHGDVLAIDCENTVVHASGRLIAVLGLNDMVVIDSLDALLVCPRDRVQDVKKVVEVLRAQGRTELI